MSTFLLLYKFTESTMLNVFQSSRRLVLNAWVNEPKAWLQLSQK